MKILLFGDIASGKTTISKQIIQNYNNFELIAIDDFRRKYGDYTMLGEKTALDKFIKNIKPNKNQIIEASGVGKLSNKIYERIRNYNESVFLIILVVPIQLIYERIKERTWDIPFPGKQEKLNDIIESINLKINENYVINLWSTIPDITILKIKNLDSKSQKFILETIINYIKIFRNETI